MKVTHGFLLATVVDLQKIIEKAKMKSEKDLMKVFCIIFSFYILLLSLQPCAEMTTNLQLRVNETSKQTYFQSDEQKDEDCDECSPFCICSCCHFSTAYQFKSFSVTNKIIFSAISTSGNFYQNPYAQTYKTSFWQPPKFDSIG